MVERSNRGKCLGQVVRDEAVDGLELVRYDRRLANYTHSIVSSRSKARHTQRTRLLVQQVASDMGLRDWRRPLRFCGALILLLLALLLRIQVHYFALFAWLMLAARPIYEATPGALRWVLRYSPISTTTSVEVGALCAGPTAVLALWSVLAGMVWGVAKISRVGAVLQIYRFVGVFGLVAAADWLLVVLVDVATLSFHSCDPQWQHQTPPETPVVARTRLKEAAERCDVEVLRLWFHFRFTEGDGAVAPVVIVIVYSGMLGVGLVLLYSYFLNLHQGGRILDLYRRLTCKEGCLMIPLDVEVSAAELHRVIASARRWRGSDHSRRRLVVTDIEIEYVAESGGRGWSRSEAMPAAAAAAGGQEGAAIEGAGGGGGHALAG